MASKKILSYSEDIMYTLNNLIWLVDIVLDIKTYNQYVEKGFNKEKFEKRNPYSKIIINTT